MCGFVSILNLDATPTPIPTKLIESMRDRLTHRGPDDAGLWEGPQGSITHRRLSVIDPTPAGHQPMQSPDGRYILAYNGELYNDHDLRSQLATHLAADARTFTSKCDTETLLHALITWGPQAITKLRGMYSFLFLDTHTNTAILARDPLGIKPLYHTIVETKSNSPTSTGTTRQLVVASEIPAILLHPMVDRKPDPVTLSAYLSSIRTTLGTRTMFAGISTLTPGQWIQINLENPDDTHTANWWSSANRTPTQPLRQTIEDSVHRHLRTDVPMCTLLSGGLDSAITTLIAKRSLGQLNTYCAGAKAEGFADDFTFAAQLAQELGTNHTEVELTQESFIERWPWMINQLAVPLSTPNEIAIYEVARALRQQGHIVALSGEGADELFAGYAPIMQQAAAHIASLNGAEDVEGGLFHLRSNAWISEELKPAVLNDAWFQAADGDQHLRDHYINTFNESRAQAAQSSSADAPLQAHLNFQRQLNLPSLLSRLDTSTMLAGVEGRTPYADIEVAIAAQSLPMDQKYINHAENLEQTQTKIALRQAFANDLPQAIVNRPKASFPLPFQHWMGPLTDRLFTSPVARAFFTEQSLGLVCARPANYWHMAWPMINLMLWGESQFGDLTRDQARNQFSEDQALDQLARDITEGKDACSGKYASSTTSV